MNVFLKATVSVIAGGGVASVLTLCLWVACGAGLWYMETIPEISRVVWGGTAGLITWLFSCVIFPGLARDLGKITGGVLTGALCGALFISGLYAPFYGFPDFVGILFGLVAGVVVGPFLSVLGCFSDLHKNAE